jgi:hypothetical protein
MTDGNLQKESAEKDLKIHKSERKKRAGEPAL